MSITYSSSNDKASGPWPPRFPRIRSSYLPRQTTLQQPHLGRIQKQLSFAKRAINKHLQMTATSNPASLASSAPSSPKLPPPALMGTDVDARLPSAVVSLPPIDGESQPDQPNYTHVHHVIHQLHAGLPAARLWPQMPGINHEVPYARSISSTAPTSPRIPPIRQNSGTSASSGTPRMRPHATTLNVPGMTRSRASPDGKIASRDVGAKLVIVMVGLPARGKSYLTKKMQRFFSWQQHDCQVFNVGNRRRVEVTTPSQSKPNAQPKADLASASQDASIFVNGTRVPIPEPTEFDLNSTLPESKQSNERPIIDQSASFFDPENQEAARQREKFAMDSLDELLDYLLIKGGSVGILDATNSTISRRKALVQRIQQREPKLNFIFVESECHDPKLLEANMRLKLSGPDYKGKDPVKSLADFKERIKAYEKAYEPIGDWEESKGFQYIKDIDVGRKMVTHQLQGFFSAALANYLSSFHLSPRQIWIARHGQSFDNVLLKLGGDSDLTDRGRAYGVALYNFITHKRQEWLKEQKNKIARASFPPVPGDQTPPYPEHYSTDLDEKNFCVWTSTLRRSVDTAEAFEKDDDYDVKQWSWLNDMHTGDFEGMSYDQIQRSFPEEYEKRRLDKLHYVYPGVGGEGYLQVIARLREMIREIERIKDHVCIISHRSICRVLLAYFKGLSTDFITDMSIPLGRIFSIEPKPYGTDFHVYQYNEATGWFDEEPESVIYKTMDPNA